MGELKLEIIQVNLGNTCADLIAYYPSQTIMTPDELAKWHWPDIDVQIVKVGPLEAWHTSDVDWNPRRSARSLHSLIGNSK